MEVVDDNDNIRVSVKHYDIVVVNAAIRAIMAFNGVDRYWTAWGIRDIKYNEHGIGVSISWVHPVGGRGRDATP